MTRKSSEHILVLRIIFLLLAIVTGVAAALYAADVHRRHLHEAKWQDYDECGIS